MLPPYLPHHFESKKMQVCYAIINGKEKPLFLEEATYEVFL